MGAPFAFKASTSLRAPLRLASCHGRIETKWSRGRNTIVDGPSGIARSPDGEAGFCETTGRRRLSIWGASKAAKQSRQLFLPWQATRPGAADGESVHCGDSQ